MIYDEDKCVTAGELRAMGLPVPREVPDIGWVPRGSFRARAGKCVGKSGGSIETELNVEYLVPFEHAGIGPRSKDRSTTTGN